MQCPRTAWPGLWAAPVTLLPSSFIGRLLAGLWLVTCLSVLVFGFVQRDIHDMPVAFTWFMIFLTFPLGFLGIGVNLMVVEPVVKAIGLKYDPFFSLLPSWLAMTAIGYMQWFKLLPKAITLVLRNVTKRDA